MSQLNYYIEAAKNIGIVESEHIPLKYMEWFINALVTAAELQLTLDKHKEDKTKIIVKARDVFFTSPVVRPRDVPLQSNDKILTALLTEKWTKKLTDKMKKKFENGKFNTCNVSLKKNLFGKKINVSVKIDLK